MRRRRSFSAGAFGGEGREGAWRPLPRGFTTARWQCCSLREQWPWPVQSPGPGGGNLRGRRSGRLPHGAPD
ncbi:unnamed protein product [Symbiodinium sp. KB8]|nr:unnamed protein product [Symbiodinium sp. KB8]